MRLCACTCMTPNLHVVCLAVLLCPSACARQSHWVVMVITHRMHTLPKILTYFRTYERTSSFGMCIRDSSSSTNKVDNAINDTQSKQTRQTDMPQTNILQSYAYHKRTPTSTQRCTAVRVSALQRLSGMSAAIVVTWTPVVIHGNKFTSTNFAFDLIWYEKRISWPLPQLSGCRLSSVRRPQHVRRMQAAFQTPSNVPTPEHTHSTAYGNTCRQTLTNASPSCISLSAAPQLPLIATVHPPVARHRKISFHDFTFGLALLHATTVPTQPSASYHATPVWLWLDSFFKVKSKLASQPALLSSVGCIAIVIAT